MASAARTASRAFLRSTPATSSFRPAARSTRFAIPTNALRTSARRGYSSEAGSEKPSSSFGLWAFGIGALGAAGGAYLYLSGDSSPKGPFVPTQADYQKVYDAIASRLADETDYDDGSYGPVLVRLAWHASGTYDKETGTGGSNGATMRFAPESDHGANAGLKTARDFLEPIKAQFPWITYSDLWTLGGACAIQEAGGPTIPWRPGREDRDVAACTPDGRLPDAAKDQRHIRDIFSRMGFDDREMVALIGAHALGRCHTDRSGFDGPWNFSPTLFTNEFFRLLVEEKWSQKKWNGPTQFTDKSTGTLMMLPTDMALIKDKGFKKHVERYAKDSDVFFKEFSDVFVKLLELGVPFKTEDRFVFKASDATSQVPRADPEQKEYIFATWRGRRTPWISMRSYPFPFSGSSSTVLSKQQIKIAYHKALLKHHPDKAGAVARETGLSGSTNPTPTSTPNPLFANSDGNSSRQLYTIDQITTAYKTLSDPALRAEYNRSLRLDRLKVAEREKTGDVFHTGLEIVDLEDLACEEAEGADGDCWYRGCRCGDERGFLVNEEDLEREAEHGEIIIGCRGCSLWLKILFAVEAEEG
ncbi:heme peroxidase [Penicillium sp. CMV-2018d]|nr:heme peroxidase [Penicillium sp. CMV-2018d]